MTEEEWLTCTDPARMVRSLQGRGGIRRPRLWTCAFFRWHRSDVGMLMRAVQIAEAWADGEEPRSLDDLSGFYVTDRVAWRAADRTARLVSSGEDSAEKQLAISYQLKSLLDIFGNPFRSVAINPTWLSTTVKNLAESIYREKAFDRLPILADALEDAGCDNLDILNHLRQPGQHCRGCWAVDLVLGKE